MIPFDAEFAARSADEFVDEVLVERARRHAGLDRRELPLRPPAPGRPAAAGAPTSASRRPSHPLLEVDGEIVSSSHIRGLVAAGEVATADRLLGAPFELRGEVVHGDERGRELGFPTANLVPDEALACPGHGVYACLRRRAPRGRQHRRAADLRDRAAAS